MLDIGFQELLIIGVIALLVFGPHRLPELARALGRALREFRRASDEFRSTIETNLQLAEESVLPPPAVAAVPGEGGDPAAEPAGVPAAPDLAAGGAEAAPAGGLDPAAVEPFLAQRGGRLLHRGTCAWAARIAEADRVAFKRAAEGVEVGLLPCPVCAPADPEEPAAPSS